MTVNQGQKRSHHRSIQIAAAIASSLCAGCVPAAHRTARQDDGPAPVVDREAGFTAALRAVAREQLSVSAQDRSAGTVLTQWSELHSSTLTGFKFRYRLNIAVDEKSAIVDIQCQTNMPSDGMQYALTGVTTDAGMVPCPDRNDVPAGWVDIQRRVKAGISSAR